MKFKEGDIVRKKTYYGYKFGVILRKGNFTNHHWLVKYERNVVEESEYGLEKSWQLDIEKGR